MVKEVQLRKDEARRKIDENTKELSTFEAKFDDMAPEEVNSHIFSSYCRDFDHFYYLDTR